MEIEEKYGKAIELMLEAAIAKTRSILEDVEVMDKTKLTDITGALAALLKLGSGGGEEEGMSLPEELKGYAV